ncbi:aldo/keto reductase [Streptomyces sp. NPDC012935]|uniref:aldo/keto reductase n=1 Tax=Streptomyces sp. NPDC012935 TaxID=3364857 RepID=UPI00367CA02A
MHTTTLGKSGLKVSRIAFGTWQLGGDWGGFAEEGVKTAVRRAREQGVNFFDTAQAYGFGASERLLGDALRTELGRNRDELVITECVANGTGDGPIPVRAVILLILNGSAGHVPSIPPRLLRRRAFPDAGVGLPRGGELGAEAVEGAVQKA